MAFTTPRVWVANEIVSAAIMQTYVSDNDSDLDARLAPTSRALFVSGTAVATGADTNLTTAWTETLAAGQLAEDLDRITVFASGTVDTGSSTHQVTVTLGSTIVFDTTAFDLVNGDWCLRVTILRTGAATQDISGQFTKSGTGGTGLELAHDNTTATETLSDALTLAVKIRNGSASANGVVFEQGAIDYHPLI